MTIETEVVSKTKAVMKLSGRLDTANAPLLEQKIRQWGGDITELVLDFGELEYISSMGLRVLLSAKKASAEKKRQFSIRNMSESVREVFEMTGFISLIVREEGFAVVRRDEPGGVALLLSGELANESARAVAEELAGIKARWGGGGIASVVLDMKDLGCIMPDALLHLSRAVAETAWDGRELSVRNVPADYAKEVGAAGLGEIAG